jgi:D-alanyl-D-alanine carboxypeptidase
VIDHASGSNVGEEFERLILRPGGLQQTFFERVPHVAAHIAHGYIRTQHGLFDTFTGAHRDGVPTNVWGTIWTDGGIVTTSGDLAAFTNALYGGRILLPATLALMEQPGPDGSYGLGTYHIGFDGHAWQGHDGAYDGFESYTFYDISRQLTVIAVVNLDTTGSGWPVHTLWRNITHTYDHI